MVGGTLRETVSPSRAPGEGKSEGEYDKGVVSALGVLGRGVVSVPGVLGRGVV